MKHTEELLKSLENAISQIELSKTRERFILTRDKNTCYRIFLNEILYCESFNTYVTFYLDDNRKITSSNLPMKKCAEILDQRKGFMRIHNKYLVNLFKIKYFKSAKDGGYVIFDGNKKVKVARSRKKDFLEVLYGLAVNGE